MRFKVLGSVDIEHDGVPLAVGGRQQRRLLGALLVARGKPVSADRLIDAVWPDGDAPDGAARSVMTYVSRLRGVVGGDRIHTSGSGYRLVGGDASVDVDEFDRLLSEAEHSLPDRAVECYEQALALWHGAAFGEFAGEWWAVAESTRLEACRLIARTERAAALISLGHPERAVPDLECLIVEQPIRERAVGLLMQALDATGRKADALRVFRTYRSHLVEETGLDPSDELLALERALVGGGDVPGDLTTGRPLRGYILHEVIGEGTFGRVYPATQPGTERRVAIKMIHPALADSSDFIRRFDAEARLVARLEHPHVVPLYDYWREPGGAYLVMRLLSGGTARDSVIAGGAWSLARVSQLVEQVGGALIAAHAVGVAHNDVKASNVLLDDAGNAYLTDFGIAVSTHDPDASNADYSADVRAFGWMLWELLTGTRSRSRSASSVVSTPIGATPSLVGRLARVPEGLDAVLARATTNDDGAYASVADLVVGWRAAVGRPEGVLSPIGSDDRRMLDSARRTAAHQLVKDTAAGVNPYKGLRPFDEADAADFFGRDTIADDLAEWVASHRLTVVVGPSGSGKSSLVRAGLVPRLAATGRAAVTMVPGEDPVAALRTAMFEVASRRGRTKDVVALIRHVVAESGPLVILVDQFEECWTRSDEARRCDFVQTLARLVEDSIDVRVLATIRADVFDRPLEEPRLGAHVVDGAFAIASMTPAQLADAITQPASAAGVAVDDAVVAELVTDAVTQPGSLPLLQFTLAELYDRRVDARVGADALHALGGMAGSIGRRAEEVYAALDDTARGDVRALFSRLVTPGDGSPDTRRRARIGELSAGVRAIADEYVAARLLVTDRDQTTREPTVEIAHEALLTGWSRLSGWIAEDRRWLTQLQHLATAARTWDANGRPSGDLYRGSRLEAAIESVELDGRDVSELEREFIAAGRGERDREVHAARRSARRLRRLLAGVGVLLVLAIVAGALAYVSQRRARDEAWAAAHQALVSNSVALRNNKRDVAALLAVEAHRLRPSAATESALFGTFTAAPGLVRTVAHEIDTDGEAIMIDSETLSFSQTSGTVHIVDLASGHARYSLEILDDERGFTVWQAVTPDGRYLATAWRGDDQHLGALAVWDLQSRERRFANLETGFPMGSVAISRDGSYVAIGGGEDARVDIYDAATGELLVEVERIPRPDDAGLRVNTVALAFTPAGELIVTSQAGPIRFVDPATGDELRRVDAPRETSEAAIRLSADGSSFITHGVLGTMRFDTASGQPLWDEPVGDAGCFESAYVERLGVLLCGEGSGRLLAVDLETGVVGELPAEMQAGGLCEILVSPDGTRLVMTSCSSRQYVVWRIDGGGAISAPVGPDGELGHVFGYTADGRLFVETQTGPDEFETRLVDVASGKSERLAGRYAPQATNEPHLVAVELSDGTGEIYDLERRARHGVLIAPDLTVFGVAVVGEGVVVWGFADLDVDGVVDFGEQWSLEVYDLDGRRQVVIAQPKDESTVYQQAAVQGAVGEFVAIECTLDRRCQLQRRDLSTGEPLGDPVGDPGGARYNSIVSRAGVLAALTEDGRLSVLDPATLQPVGAALPGTSGYADAMSLSDDGRRLLVLGGDATLRIYDVPSRTQLGDVIRVGYPDGAALRRDGLEAAARTDDGFVVWDLDPEHWIEAACRVAGRNLTRAEWDQYLGDLAPYHETCPDFGSAA